MPQQPAPGPQPADDDAMSRWSTNRRIVLKAMAGMAALSASGIGAVPNAATPALAQEVDGTRARSYVPSEQGIAAADAAQGEWVTFQADYPFWALGVSWNGDVGTWPIVAVQLSTDGVTWSDTIDVAANTEDGGQPNRDGRLFTPLIFTDGTQWVRYQTIDSDRLPGVVEGLEFVYIDPTDGPWAKDIAPAVGSSEIAALTVETMAPPEIVTRAQWGADETWRFNSAIGEVWPPEYATVSHIIVHHTATTNRPLDVPGAIRSIYYYHAVSQGWGDIGYNYLVDHNGRIYQGRYGGQDVIGGHSYQFAVGSSGIGLIGNFTSVEPTEAAMSALVSICAWVGRDLNPLGTSNFHEAPNLPTISSHRDVNQTTCPGTLLWDNLATLRQLVARTLEDGVLDTALPAGIVPGDRVRVQTGGSTLNLRSAPGGTIIGSLADGATAWVIDGPTKRTDGNWYQVRAESNGATGWVIAQFLIVDPDLIVPGPGDLRYGLNLRVASTVNLRRSPSTSAGIVASLPTGTWAMVMAGPIDAGGQQWYQIRAYQFGDGWVIRSAIEPAPLNLSPNASFPVGSTVEATQSVQVRPRYGIANATIASASTGTRMTITVAPVEVTGFIWYGVYSSSFGGGWVVQNNLRASAPPPAAKFRINDTFRVSESTNLRSSPSTSAGVLTTMGAGTTGTVIGGPTSANGYTWWNVRLANGTVGWCIENWLVKTTGTTPPPSSKFRLNDTFRITQTTNLRSAPGTSATIRQTMSAGTTGTVIGGPTAANGYNWWNVRLTNGTVGWCVENWMEKTTTTPPPPPPTGKFDIGDRVRVTESLRMRSSASTTATIVAVLPAGTTGTVLAGPTTASGYTWWRIQTSLGTGWCAQDWLVETTTATPPPPTTGYPAGTVVEVNSANLRLRSAASTTGTVLALLPLGHRLTVVSGPTTGSGYDWYRVTSTTYGTGYVVDDFITRV